MKKGLLSLCLTAASLAAFGQGKVLFGNDSNHYFYVVGPFGADPSGPIHQSPLPSGHSLEAALYAGQSSSSMTLQTAVVLTGANWVSPGLMANKAITLPWAGGTPDFFDIFVTDTGATLPATGSAANLPAIIAISAFAYFGDSGLFTATPGTGISFPGLVSGTATSSTWTGNLLINIPEPTSFSFLGLGAAGMWLLRRQKAVWPEP